MQFGPNMKEIWCAHNSGGIIAMASLKLTAKVPTLKVVCLA